MKPAPAPNVPGNTEFERFESAFRKVLTVSKEDLVKAEVKCKARELKSGLKRSPDLQSAICRP